MALVIFPTTNYNSFVSVADATDYITQYTLQYDAWNALDLIQQEALLRIAAMDLLNNSDSELFPIDPIDDCIPMAQALMASQDATFGFSSKDIEKVTGALKREKVSVIEVEYYDTIRGNGSGTAPRIPSMIRPCLEAIGYVFSSGTIGLKQTILGRS